MAQNIVSDMQVEQWPVSSLTHYDRNPRKNDHVVARMADSIREFGFRVPVLIQPDGRVIDGHLRLKAAVACGMDAVPVVVVDDLDPVRVRAFRIAINRMAELADWDEDLLAQELLELDADGFDLDLAGFDEAEIDSLTGEPEPGPGDDDVPPLPDTPQTAPGDLWIMGEHRLLCGDATLSADFERLMEDEQSHMVFTDPPYNVDYSGKAGKIMNDNMRSSSFYAFLRAVMDNISRVIIQGGVSMFAMRTMMTVDTCSERRFSAQGSNCPVC